jgi:hypothetical protein
MRFLGGKRRKIIAVAVSTKKTKAIISLFALSGFARAFGRAVAPLRGWPDAGLKPSSNPKGKGKGKGKGRGKGKGKGKGQGKGKGKGQGRGKGKGQGRGQCKARQKQNQK